jgi:hypothetical protein
MADKLAATERKYLEEIAKDDHRHPPELLAAAARARREIRKDHPEPEGEKRALQGAGHCEGNVVRPDRVAVAREHPMFGSAVSDAPQ